MALDDILKYDQHFYDSLLDGNDIPQDLLNAYAEIVACEYAPLSYWSRLLEDRALAHQMQQHDAAAKDCRFGSKRKSSFRAEGSRKRRAWINLSPPSEPGETAFHLTASDLQDATEISSSDDEQDLDDDLYSEPQRNEIAEPQRSQPPSLPETPDDDSHSEKPDQPSISPNSMNDFSPPGKDSATILIGSKRQPFHFPKAAIAGSVMARGCHWDYDNKSWRIESRPAYQEISPESFTPVAEFLQTGDIGNSLQDFALLKDNTSVLTFLATLWDTTCRVHLPALQLRIVDEVKRYRPWTPLGTMTLAMAMFQQEPSLGVEDDFDAPESIAKRLVAEEISRQWYELWDTESKNLAAILTANEDLACAVHKLLHEDSLKKVKKVDWMWRAAVIQASTGAQESLTG